MHLATCRGHVSIFYFSGIHYLHDLENQGRYCHSLYPGYKIWQYVSRRTIALLTLLSSSIFHVPYRRRGKFVDGPSLEVAATRRSAWYVIHVVSMPDSHCVNLSKRGPRTFLGVCTLLSDMYSYHETNHPPQKNSVHRSWGLLVWYSDKVIDMSLVALSDKEGHTASLNQI